MENLQAQYEALQEEFQRLQQQQEQQRVQQQAVAAQPALTDINRVSVKLPPFWKDKSSLWFAQVEAQFSLANITSEATKYAYVVAHLEERYAHEVEDILTNTPERTPYTTLKTELIKRLSVSEEQRIRQLLMEEELGDRKPSQFLRHLRSLAGTGPIKDDLLRAIWRQRLPTYVQAILQTQPDTVSLEGLATVADKVMEVHPASAPTVNAATAPAPTENLSAKIEELSRQFASLQSEVRKIRFQNRSRSRDKSHQIKYHSRSPSPVVKNATTLCWYHEHFADKARKCTSPCTFASPNTTGNP